MTIEYICTEPECGYSFVDILVIPRCKCPKCNAETEPYEWEPVPED